MKKAIITILVIMTLITTAFAANTNVTKAGNFHIMYNGTEQAFTDVNGSPVLPLVNEGTTYLPIRAMSNLAGLNVEWVGETSTINLTSGGTQKLYNGTPSGSTESVSVVISDNIVVTLDGTVKTFTDVNGKVVYPLNFNGTTYLPVRAVCGLVNIPVEWDGTTSTIYLGTRPAAPVQSDTKSISPERVTVTRNKYGVDPNTVYVIDTTGYERLRFSGATEAKVAMYASLEDVKAGNATYYGYPLYSLLENTFDVTEYTTVYVSSYRTDEVTTGSEVPLTFTLEHPCAIPENVIPVGATQITENMVTYDTGINKWNHTYSNGTYFLTGHNSSGDPDGRSFHFTNSGWTKLTLTVTPVIRTCQVCFDEYYGGARILRQVKANASTTLTFDITGITTPSIRFGVYETGAYITSVYVQ